MTGRIGAFTFRRAWSYWIVSGPMPLDVARRLYADPVGATDIRVNGHCGCPAPGEPGGRPTWTLPDGRIVLREWERADFEKIGDEWAPGWRDKYVFTDDPESIGARGAIDCYHVDSELGLFKIAEAIRSLAEAPRA